MQDFHKIGIAGLVQSHSVDLSNQEEYVMNRDTTIVEILHLVMAALPGLKIEHLLAGKDCIRFRIENATGASVFLRSDNPSVYYYEDNLHRITDQFATVALLRGW